MIALALSRTLDGCAGCESVTDHPQVGGRAGSANTSERQQKRHLRQSLPGVACSLLRCAPGKQRGAVACKKSIEAVNLSKRNPTTGGAFTCSCEGRYISFSS